jgi:hypothetical protein
MAVLWEQLGSELSLFRANQWTCTWNRNLHFCRTEIHYDVDDVPYKPTPDDDLLHDVMMKLLRCGKRPNCSYFTEKQIVEIYGDPYGIEKKPSKIGSIVYKFDKKLADRYQNFTDVLDPWQGDPEEVDFDPEHPKNERFMFKQMLSFFDRRLAHCMKTQVPLEDVLPRKIADNFIGQRGDFLLSFPNGKALLLEPGDHDDGSQKKLDQRRDLAFQDANIQTLRPRNSDLKEKKFYKHLEGTLKDLDALPYLEATKNRSKASLSENYLFLLPSLITRIERLLSEFFFKRGLLQKKSIRVGVVERDLECVELAVASFLDRVQRLSQLYGIELKIPAILLQVERNQDYRFGDLTEIHEHLASLSPGVSVEVVDSLEAESFDLFLDVGIKCNELTSPRRTGTSFEGVVRQAFAHNNPVRFNYRSRTRSIVLTKSTEDLLTGFLQDSFRKENLRSGQAPIIRNIMQQKSTVGLLPTSAGKSICYQLAAFLTPGVTVVVDPLVALMNDQAQGLGGDHGIDHCFAWHSGKRILGDKAGEILRENQIVFLAPERFQAPSFREAMEQLGASDLFVNYAVIDEAHCVSMWGHDFRPSYLMLEKNIREYCTFQKRNPVIVALTGTASQSVLLDLQRELNIQGTSDIVRPKTFDRPELSYFVESCPSKNKEKVLRIIEESIANQLNVHDLDKESDGIVFISTRWECWKIFGSYVGDAKEYVRTVLVGDEHETLSYGIYTGSPPRDSGFSKGDWNEYKSKTLRLFKMGKIKRLFGTSAVSVGIDNPRLNYIINYKMPNSLEQFYQQCGRAGRSGQDSICHLIFSDDNPKQTEEWLNGTIKQIPGRRWDDIGTLHYFHKNNFPGKEIDTDGTMKVLQAVLESEEADTGLREIDAYITTPLEKEILEAHAKRTERYVGFLLILKLVEDYQVKGMGRAKVFQIRLNSEFESFISANDNTGLKNHVVDSLVKYRHRYQGQQQAVVEDEGEASDLPWDRWCIQHLVSFLYGKIEYRRRVQMRTMRNFCLQSQQKDSSPEDLRSTIRLYFDGNPKFTKHLESMKKQPIPASGVIKNLVSQVSDYEDVDSLKWETQSFLDEDFHLGWAAMHLYSSIYRTPGVKTTDFDRTFDEMKTKWLDLLKVESNRDACLNFMAEFLSSLISLESVADSSGKKALFELVTDCLGRLPSEYLGLIESLNVDQEQKELLDLHFVNLQLKEILGVANTFSIR